MRPIHTILPAMLFMTVTTSVLAQPASQPADVLQASCHARIEPDKTHAQFTALAWDTEGGDRDSKNLLRAPLVLRWTAAGKVHSSGEIEAQPKTDKTGLARYDITVAPDAALVWSCQNFTFELNGKGEGLTKVERLEMVFPFNPGLTPTTVLPADCDDKGSLTLPAIISAPDYGQMLLSSSDADVKGRLEGSRARKWADFILDIPTASLSKTVKLTLAPVWLPPPLGLHDLQMWRSVRRGWFNVFQPTARWGEEGKPFSAPPGLLGNNVLSDPCSLALHFYADQAFWTPELAPGSASAKPPQDRTGTGSALAKPGISVMNMVRRAIDFWLDHRTRPTGEVVGYWDYGNFLDANASPIIAAWDYVEVTGDRDWLGKRIERLEFIADFLAKRDIDSDGMIEATQSGNRGTLKQPARSCAWWDAINCGHKDGYTNAIIYRAFRCLADLERRAGRGEQADRYTKLADRLKASYSKTLFNAKTGWLAWWKSQDGELHDYASPVVNGLAIEYGLVEPAEGKKILARLRDKMRKVDFKRLDLGVPGVLVPVPRADYLLPDSLGCPHKEDGTDTFGQYMNGGISAGQGTHFIAAHYIVGEQEEGDRFLKAMLTRQAGPGFHNGVRDAAMQGGDWTTWDGKPCGYEGYLSDSFRFLQAAVLREKALRERFYRPLTPPAAR